MTYRYRYRREPGAQGPETVAIDTDSWSPDKEIDFDREVFVCRGRLEGLHGRYKLIEEASI